MTDSHPKEWLRRLRGDGRPAADREIDDEIAFHLEMETRKYRQQGFSEEEAARRARLSFGAAQRFKEECRDERQGSHIDMLIQDVRFTLRTLTKNWGFATTAILTLALGIGANTAIFSVIYGVLLRPLPYRDGNDLVLLQQARERPGVGTSPVGVSIPDFYDYRDQSQTFDELVEYHTMFFVLLGRGEPERVQTGVVSDNFFDTLGVPPLHGRTFVEGEDDLDSEAVLVLSYDYWQRSFGGDPNVIGQVFEMNTRPHTVVGILPQIPQYPNTVDVYMPTSACPFRANAERNMAGNRNAFRALTVFGRLADGATAPASNAEVASLTSRFGEEYPEVYDNFEASTLDLKEQLTAGARPVLMMLLATAGLVLLIACANVANLSLARVMRREQEVAVRAALGASRGRLMRQLFTESMVLALLGGALGLVFAYFGLDMLVSFAARFTPRATQVGIDGWVLLFTLLVSLGTGVAFGTFPALPGTRDLSGAIKDGARSTAAGGLTLRRVLIVAQVALSFILLVGAGLTLKSLTRLQAIDPGFETEQVLTARVSINWNEFTDQESTVIYLRDLLTSIGESPVVRSAALTIKPPYRSTNPFLAGFLVEGQDALDAEAQPQLDQNVVSADYFEVLDIPVVRGRSFDPRDQPDSDPVAIINETLAAQYWPDQDPIGARISTDNGTTWVTVVGVAGDTRLYGPETEVTPEFYQVFGQNSFNPTWLMVRTVGEPGTAAQQVKDAAYAVSGANPISDLEALATTRADAVASPRLTAALLGVFALLALVVTVTGIAGVMAFAVSQRTREMGLRLALGAQPNSILAMVVRQGMIQVAVGLVLGVVGSIAFGRVLAGLLFQVEASDPATFILVILAITAAALIAVVLPARRAVSVDPVTALRAD